MSNQTTKSLAEQLLEDHIPALVDTSHRYRTTVSNAISPEQTQFLASIRQRIKQCVIVLRKIHSIERKQPWSALHVMFEAAQSQGQETKALDSQMQELDELRALTENFYSTAFLVIRGIAANQAGLREIKLPNTPAELPFIGVVMVRNWIIEHPRAIQNTFDLGGMVKGPILNGGKAEDSKGNKYEDRGVYANAIEWCEIVSNALNQAAENFEAKHRR